MIEDKVDQLYEAEKNKNGPREKPKLNKLKETALKQVKKDILIGIGNRLREIRDKNGKTQDDIANMYSAFDDITGPCLSKWENGNNGVNLFFLIWFAHEFNVDLNWLITGKEHTPITQELIETLEHALEIAGNYSFQNGK